MKASLSKVNAGGSPNAFTLQQRLTSGARLLFSARLAPSEDEIKQHKNDNESQPTWPDEPTTSAAISAYHYTRGLVHHQCQYSKGS
jgi:hypothetical protein